VALEIDLGGALPGRTGDVIVTASESISLSGFGSGVVMFNADGGPGALRVTTPILTMADGASLASFGQGIAPGSDVTVDVGQLTMTASTVTSEGVAGGAGNLHFMVAGAATIDGDFGGVFSRSGGTGTSGAILMEVGSLAVRNGSVIQSGTIGGTQAGPVTIVAQDSVLIGDRSGIASQAFVQDVGPISITARDLTIDHGYISTSTLEAFRAGDVTLNLVTFALLNGGQVTSSGDLLATGTGGSIVVNASGGVTMSGRSADGIPVSPFGTVPASGLYSTGILGNAGTITVTSPSVIMGPDSKMSVSTFGDGRGGDLQLNVGRFLARRAGLFSTASGAGDGGSIGIDAIQVALENRSIVSATSEGTGLAGNIAIAASDSFTSQNSTVTTAATTSDGGNITFTVGQLFYLLDSSVTTSVQSGAGGGGNITIDPQFVILNRSAIRANAFGGPGGNITIAAGVFLAPDSAVTASSVLDVPGVIDIQASVSDVSGSLVQLPAEILEASALLRASCATRLAESSASTLVIATRDGIPREPGGLLSSPVRARPPEVAGLRLAADGAAPLGGVRLAGLFHGLPCAR
jgi:large exoprotein involved in heme utilization and adhesion